MTTLVGPDRRLGRGAGPTVASVAPSIAPIARRQVRCADIARAAGSIGALRAAPAVAEAAPAVGSASGALAGSRIAAARAGPAEPARLACASGAAVSPGEPKLAAAMTAAIATAPIAPAIQYSRRRLSTCRRSA